MSASSELALVPPLPPPQLRSDVADESASPALVPAVAPVWFDILLCYLYTPVGDAAQVAALAAWFIQLCDEHCAIGRVLVSAEGVNVNVACRSDDGDIDAVCEGMRLHRLLGSNHTRGNAIDFKVERRASNVPPFPDIKVSIVKEIVPTAGDMPMELLDSVGGGTHLSPEEFHRVLTAHGAELNGVASAPVASASAAADCKELVVIDVRNRKEMQFGHFRGAMSSDTKMFSEWAVSRTTPYIFCCCKTCQTLSSWSYSISFISCNVTQHQWQFGT